MKTVVGLFDDMSAARQAATDLEAAGVSTDDISIVANNEGGRYASTDTTTGAPTISGHAIGHDAVVGAEIGAVGGLLLGLTGLAIPGLGWIAGAGWLMGTVLGAGTGAVVGGLVGALTHVGVPSEDATNYNEGVRRGGTLVAVKAPDDMAHRVAEILGDDGAVDIDERAAQYAQTGYGSDTTSYKPSSATTGYTAPVAATGTTGYVAPVTTAASTGYAADTSTAYKATDSAVIPVVEEELQVGKREVQRGGVRVYTHTTETPVEQQVTLHEEHVTVNRTPVNRTATQGDIDSAMRDRSIELTETAEEAVIAKQARVIEEVTIGKTGSDRTETVRDTVRRTDVDVEELDDDDVTTHSTTTRSNVI